jgi:F-box protein 33
VNHYVIKKTSQISIDFQILSLDYDVMCDDFIESLSMISSLRKLILHVHGLDENHPGISEQAWTKFREKNSIAEVNLTLVKAIEAVDLLHVNLFRPSMPLSKLKVMETNV